MLRRGAPCAPRSVRHAPLARTEQRRAYTANPEIRVRYAPSPTGYMHLGGLRTSLYNYLFAKKHNGKFLLRIEDTDQTRLVPGAAENLARVLRWSGVPYDEGPDTNSKFGPYVQSQRLDIYRKHAEHLLEHGHAYRCFCTTQRLQLIRDGAAKQGLGSAYDRKCLRLTPAEIQEKLKQGTPYTIRMKVPAGHTVLNDIVRGTMKFANSFVDDQVLLKSDQFPTYHLANVVDDHLMQITHVIRGEEWINSTPKHLMLYKMFGWSAPQFAHLPLLLNEDKSKLSKRQNDVSVDHYIEEGYLPEAIINFVAFLGWAPSNSAQEMFTLEELMKEFKLENVHKAGAVVDLSKLKWFNQQHLRKIIASNPRRIVDELLPSLEKKFPGARLDRDFIAKALQVVSERLVLAKDFLDFTYIFRDPDLQSEEARKFREKCWHAQAEQVVQSSIEALAQLKDWKKADIHKALEGIVRNMKLSVPQVFHPLRLLVTGTSVGVSVADVMEALGKEVVLARLRRRA